MSRFIHARVVDPIEFAGDAVSGPRKQPRNVRRLLRKARKLKARVASLKARHPLGWKAALRRAKDDLRAVMGDLKRAGWKPTRPSRAARPGEDEMDAALDDIPAAEPGESDDDPALDEPDADDAPDDAAEGANWLDTHVGVEPIASRRATGARRPVDLFRAAWSKPVPLGDGARITTRSGQRAMVATVQPGLYIVQLVSDAASQRIAGDNVGILPLLLYPLVRDQVRKILAKGAPAQAAPAAPPPANPAPAPAPAGVGCDCTPKRS